jgi:hypothetical protein
VPLVLLAYFVIFLVVGYGQDDEPRGLRFR